MRSAAFTTCIVFGCLAVALSAQTTRTVKDGVFSAVQAERGAALYKDKCAHCHNPDLSGGIVGTGGGFEQGGPSLAGQEALDYWKNKTVAEMVEKIEITMPGDFPGMLNRQQATDLFAFILRQNKFPAGPNDLPMDPGVLKSITIIQ